MATSAADHYEIRFREYGTLGWSDIVTSQPVAELTLAGLNRDKTYDVEVRAVSACGAKSTWVLVSAVVPDANQRISNDNINTLRMGGVGSAWKDLSISAVTTPTSATISTTTGTLQNGGTNPVYDAASVVVSGTADTTVTYYLYFDDPSGQGGTVALQQTTVFSDLGLSDGRVFVGQVDVYFPVSGSGGSTGNPGGGSGPGCPVVDAWVIRRAVDGPTHCRAGDVRVDDYLLLASGRWGRVTYSKATLQPCVRVTGQCGKSLSCSRSAPLGLAAGGDVLAADAQGVVVRIRPPVAVMADAIAAVDDIGMQWVQHITCENDFFWAGDEQDCLFAHHNLKPIDPI